MIKVSGSTPSKNIYIIDLYKEINKIHKKGIISKEKVNLSVLMRVWLC